MSICSEKPGSEVVLNYYPCGTLRKFDCYEGGIKYRTKDNNNAIRVQSDYLDESIHRDIRILNDCKNCNKCEKTMVTIWLGIPTSGGDIYVDGEIKTGYVEVESGSSHTFEAKPWAGWVFSYWYESIGGATSTSNPVTFSNITKTGRLNANFYSYQNPGTPTPSPTPTPTPSPAVPCPKGRSFPMTWWEYLTGCPSGYVSNSNNTPSTCDCNSDITTPAGQAKAAATSSVYFIIIAAAFVLLLMLFGRSR